MYGVNLSGLEDRQKETGKIQRRFCEKVLRIPRFVANGVAELQMASDSWRSRYCVWGR
jgi:hypothetical protein